jgi:NADH-quinone oxidoreductase subunit A
MRTDFAFVGVMIVTAALLMGVTLIAASLLRPKKPSKAKLETYECGMETVGDTWVQFRVQYYVLALVFVVFDIEAVLLFPVAVAFNALPWLAVINLILFILILLIALLYAWRKGALDWE